LWNAPPAPVVRGRWPAVRAPKSRNTLAQCRPWQQVIRFPRPQRSQGAGAPKQWQPSHACHGSRDDGLCVDSGSPPCTPGSTRERSTLLRRPFIHAIEGHHPHMKIPQFLWTEDPLQSRMRLASTICTRLEHTRGADPDPAAHSTSTRIAGDRWYSPPSRSPRPASIRTPPVWLAGRAIRVEQIPGATGLRHALATGQGVPVTSQDAADDGQGGRPQVSDEGGNRHVPDEA
jgi:hypothetical protein